MKIKLSSNCSAEGYSDWELNNVYLVRSILRSMVLCIIQLLWQTQSPQVLSSHHLDAISPVYICTATTQTRHTRPAVPCVMRVAGQQKGHQAASRSPSKTGTRRAAILSPADDARVMLLSA